MNPRTQAVTHRRNPGIDLAEAADRIEDEDRLAELDREAEGHDVDLRSEEHKRAALRLGNAVHPGALGRLYELWPRADVRVQHRTERVLVIARMDGNVYEERQTTLVAIRLAQRSPAIGVAVCHPGDQWERRRGIELAFRRALNIVRERELDLRPEPAA